jgi:transcriptional regulator with XRE-family HTH domain
VENSCKFAFRLSFQICITPNFAFAAIAWLVNLSVYDLNSSILVYTFSLRHDFQVQKIIGVKLVTKRRQPTKSQKTLGEMVKHRRQTLSLSQRALAEMLGVRGSHVAYLEMGRRRPSLALLKRLADVLQLDRWQLFLLAHPEAKSLLSSSTTPAPREDPTKAWQRFANTRALRGRYHITPREIQALKHLSLLGYVLTELEFLAVLTLIRRPGGG